MIIGLCGNGFPAAREALTEALPDAQLRTVDVSRVNQGQALETVDVLVPLSEKVDAVLMDAVQPRLIQQFGVGLEGVDRDAAAARGIPVQGVPAANSGAVAELVIMQLLMLLRHHAACQASIKEGRFGDPIGVSLAGKTVTVLGTGAIGARVASLLAAFDVHVLGVGRREWNDYPGLHGTIDSDDFYSFADLHEALSRSNAVIVCCPLTNQTANMIDATAFAAMPAGGYLVNIGRAGVVDRDALLHALKSHHLAGAGLDVFWREPIDPSDELLTLNTVVTPHIAGVTRESYAAMAEVFSDQLREAGIA